MTALDLEYLLARHEGVRRFAYDDATGKPMRPGTIVRGKVTVGVGRNLVDTGLFADEISYLLRNDIERCRADVDKVLPWWRTLSEAREEVLVGICASIWASRAPSPQRMLAACEGQLCPGSGGDAGLPVGQAGRRAGR